MYRTLMGSIIFLIVVEFMACESDPLKTETEERIKNLNEAQIIYLLSGEDFTENRVITKNSKDYSLDRPVFSWSLRMNRENQFAAYIKPSERLDYIELTNTSPLCLSHADGSNEKILLNDSTAIYYYVEWVNESTIAVSMQNGMKEAVIAFYDLQGDALFSYNLADDIINQVYMLPNRKHLVVYGEKHIVIIDSQELTAVYTYTSDLEIATYKLPSYTGSTLIFDLFNKQYLHVNLSDFSDEIVTLDQKMVYCNRNNTVYYTDNKLKLYHAEKEVGQVDLSDYHFEQAINLTNDQHLYCVAERGDDQMDILLIDFQNGKMTKVTSHQEDNIIYDARYCNN